MRPFAIKILLSLQLALFADASWAETTKIGEGVTQPSDYFGQIMLSLLLVLLIIFIAAWLLRRFGRFPGVAQGNLKVLGALSVGQRERIMLIQAGKEQILVGVTSSRISRLHQLEEPVEVTDNETDGKTFSQSPFAKRLAQALQPQDDRRKQREDT